MRKLVLVATLGLSCAGVAGCGERGAAGNDTADSLNAAPGTEGAETGAAGTPEPSGSAAFPEGARIVEEGGTTWRIDPDGARVRLGPNDARVVVENGVRFRVGPDGTRVRIGEDGMTVQVDDDVNVRVGGNPSVEINTGR